MACLADIRSLHAPVSTNHIRIQCDKSASVILSSIVAEHAAVVFWISVLWADIGDVACVDVGSVGVWLAEGLVGRPGIANFVVLLSWSMRRCSASGLIGRSGNPVGVICPGRRGSTSLSDQSFLHEFKLGSMQGSRYLETVTQHTRQYLKRISGA